MTGGTDLLWLGLHFASLSLLSIGGALGTAPEMRRVLVDERGWLTGVQFTDAIAIAQAAPGPNVLFVTLLGWQAAGIPGALAATVGLLLPSSLATLFAWRLKAAHAASPLVAAIRLGLSPIAVGLTASAGWIIAAEGNGDDLRLWALTAVATAAVAFTRVNLLWLIGAGALVGILGGVGPSG
jgi:chromate transporter